MSFSLRTVMIAIAVFAVALVFFEPFGKPTYKLTYGGGSASWEYATARSCFVFRGPSVPTLVFGFGYSKAIPYLQADNLPYVIYLEGDELKEAEFDSVANVGNQLTVSTSTLIRHRQSKIEVVYELRNAGKKDGETVITEHFFIDGKEYDLGAGRVFGLDLDRSTSMVRQLECEPFNRSMFPGHLECEIEEVRLVLQWWQKIRATKLDE